MKFTKEDNDRILLKLVELKNVFQFGERVVPMIQSLTTFMEEVIPLLQKVNISINESNQKMPIAKNQIENVTSATELATTEILDHIDAATIDLDTIQNKCSQFSLVTNSKIEKIEKLKSLTQDLPEVLSIVNEIADFSEYSDIQNCIETSVSNLNDRNFQVTISLQVQDITSQQLAAVNHLISSVHEKLDKLITDIDNSQISTDIKKINTSIFDDLPQGPITFDANASYAKDDRQEKADKVIQEHQGGNPSQDEIDKLFSSFK